MSKFRDMIEEILSEHACCQLAEGGLEEGCTLWGNIEEALNDPELSDE